MKVGDKVKLNLTKKIERVSKYKKDFIAPGTLELWEAINGREGVVVEVISDDEIWVKGKKTGVVRMFNKATLEVI